MYSTNRQRSESTSGVVDLDMSESTPPSLDELLSPKAKGNEISQSEKRESMTDSGVEIEVVDDDSRFSNVPLSGGTLGSGQDSRASFSASSIAERRSTVSFERPGSTASSSRKSHKKSASSYTVGSSSRGSVGNLPFLLQRLDLQKSQEETNLSKRISLDGQQRLQEEFSRIQNGHQSCHPETETEKTIDWEFWGKVMGDYRQFASDNPEKLAKAIERGIPKSLRGMMWQLMSASKDTDLEATYSRHLKGTSPHEKAILRDLGRTFPHHDYFTDGQGIGQENLFNVLKAYSLYDPEVGYCQGLPFVVAILLLNMPDEEAFCLLVRLMYSYGLRGHFLPEMPGLQLRMYQFDRLVEELLPVLHVHFLRQGVKSSMFCSQWFLTVFSYRFPLDIVFRIYDNVLASGIESIFGFSVILLQKNEEALLKLKFDDILVFLKNRLFEQYIYEDDSKKAANGGSNYNRSLNNPNESYRVNKFVQDALSLKITPFMLDVYAHEYEELVRTREAHMVEMDNLRNANRHLTAQVKNLETSLAQLNTEQCDMVKELVMQRIKSEEMENELVRYKLLYAEAMHKTEDANARSSHRLSTFSAPR